MGLKRKDFQKAAAFLKEFLLKLSEDIECAELRDTLMLTLLHMQKYYRLLQCRTQERTSQHQLSLSARGLSPMTPFVDAPDKFQWKWVSLDSTKYLNSSTEQDEGFYHVPDIILATREGNLEWISKLIHEDPSLCDATDSLGRSSLLYAIQYNHLDVLEYLLDNGADPNVVTHDGTSPIHKACHDGNHIALGHLIDHGGDIHAQDNQLRSPVHWAVTTPQLKCLQHLLQNKVDVSTRDKDGLTPCMWACRVDHIMHFEMLYNVYKQLSNNREYETDDGGRTWIHWAVRKTESLKCLKYLLSRDSATLKDGDGKTVILVAAELGSFPACKLIFDLVGPHVVHDCDNMNRTALHLATIRGHGTVLNFLLENGADLEARDSFQATAWDYAKNKQLHYCQLIMMSHKRQFLQSSPRDTCLNGNSTGNNANLEPWIGNTPDSTPRRIPYNFVSTDRSNNDDVTSRNNSDRNETNYIQLHHNNNSNTNNNNNNSNTNNNNNNSNTNNNNNNSNTNNNNYYSIKTNTNSDKNNYIPDPKSTFIKINPQPLPVSNEEIPASNNVHNKANVVKPIKDLISSPCPPKKSKTVSRLARVSFQHRSLSESFEQHPSNTQTVDYAIMETRQMSKSDGTESRLGVYESQNTSDSHYTSIDRHDCAGPDVHADSNEDIEVISDEMNVSNIEEHDQHPSLVAATRNLSDAHQISAASPFPYLSRNSPTTPTLEEAPSHLELPNQEPETCSHVDFPHPRPPPSPILSSPNGSHSPGILLNRRNLLSQNQLKSQLLLKQPMKPRSSAKMSTSRLIRNPPNINISEAPQTGKVLKSSSFGLDNSEEHKENSGALSWQGLAPVLMNMSASFIAPVNPILSQQEEPLPKFLHKESMPPSGANLCMGKKNNFSNNALPASDRHTDFSSGNFKLTEISDLSVSAASSKPGMKGMMDSQAGTMIQQHLSPSSSPSSLSIAGHNKTGNSNMFHSSSQPSELNIGGQKPDIQRLSSAFMHLTNAASLTQNQQQIVRKKKKRKKPESEEFPFENTVIKGKSLQNLSLHHQLGSKQLAAIELPAFAVESKTDYPNPGMESIPLPLNRILNSPKKPESRSKDCSFGTSNNLYPTVISSSKGKGCAGGFQMTSSIQQDTQNRGLQKEVVDNQHAAQNKGDLNDFTTVGTGLARKRATTNHIASSSLTPVSNSRESNQDLMSEKLHPVPTSKEKWSLAENNFPTSSKKQQQSTSPYMVEPDLVKSKPPLPYARKSFLH